MTVENQDYKLRILDHAVNQCIDNLLPNSNEDALSVILYQGNEIVWRVATEIYTKSGHQIDFLFIRELLNLRIKPLQNQIAEKERIRQEKEAEKSRITAELEAQKLAKEIEEERLRKIREAEAAQIRAEQEIIKKKREEEEQKKLQKFKQEYPDINIKNYKEFEFFIRIKNIIIEQLEVEEEQVKLDTIFGDLIPESYDDWRDKMQREHTWCYSSGYINSRDLEQVELIMTIEEEFNIEISDGKCEDFFSWNVGKLVNLVMQEFD